MKNNLSISNNKLLDNRNKPAKPNAVKFYEADKSKPNIAMIAFVFILFLSLTIIIFYLIQVMLI